MNPETDPAARRRAPILATLVLAAALAPPGAASEAPSPPVYGVRLERAWIPMRDGVRLAVNLYMPDGAGAGEKLPALLEYLPYRKDDGTLARDYAVHSYFARRGYVGARVDIRGTGNSEGRTPDREYSEQEQLDGTEVIAWLARQPWSNGNVGMFGISWGGFNSIQMAARRPPALKAIIAIEATEDLFQDDVHYIDGLMHIDQYIPFVDHSTSLTGAPEFSLEEAVLGARFDKAPWSLLWLNQQRDGPFWERASTRNRYDAIRIPAFLIGGWYDGYRDSVPRMLERLKAPVKAMIGPWNHSLPHESVPGPAIEWRQEAVRWWDQWLKGRDTGILDEPRFAVYVRHWYPPDVTLETVPGEWRFEEGWPPRRLQQRTLYMGADHALGERAPAAGTHQLKYVPSAGLATGFWWGDPTPDQRSTDAWSLLYDSAPLEAEAEILGFPKALLSASATAPLAHWFVRLSDVAPDGSVTQVTGAGLNGAHRESAAKPKPLVPGEVYALEIEMHFTSWVFPKGHRIRVAVSNAAWPMIWPTPHPMTTSLELGGERASRVILPVVTHEERPKPRFLPPEPSETAPGVRAAGDTWPGTWILRRDEPRQASHVEWRGTSNTEYPWGRIEHRERLTYDVRDARPDLNAVHGESDSWIHLDGRVLNWSATVDVTSDVQNFFYRFRRELYRDGLLVREKTWEETIPRDHQ